MQYKPKRRSACSSLVADHRNDDTICDRDNFERFHCWETFDSWLVVRHPAGYSCRMLSPYIQVNQLPAHYPSWSIRQWYFSNVDQTLYIRRMKSSQKVLVGHALGNLFQSMFISYIVLCCWTINLRCKERSNGLILSVLRKKNETMQPINFLLGIGNTDI